MRRYIVGTYVPPLAGHVEYRVYDAQARERVATFTLKADAEALADSLEASRNLDTSTR